MLCTSYSLSSSPSVLPPPTSPTDATLTPSSCRFLSVPLGVFPVCTALPLLHWMCLVPPLAAGVFCCLPVCHAFDMNLSVPLFVFCCSSHIIPPCHRFQICSFLFAFQVLSGRPTELKQQRPGGVVCPLLVCWQGFQLAAPPPDSPIADMA